MSNKIVYLRGRAMWAKLDKPDLNYDKKTKSWTIDVELDEDSWKLYEEAGIQLKPRERDGKKFVTFKRQEYQMRKGNYEAMDPPEVIGADASEVGNGSVVVAKVYVYTTAKGNGHRLEAVKVEDLVKYKKPEVKALEGTVPF